VFRPAGTRGVSLPLAVYLPGFGGSSEDALKQRDGWNKIVTRLHDAGKHIVVAVVDGRNRSPGHRSDHLEERIIRGIRWVLGAPVRDVAP
jgi:hypothetical protein